MHHAVHYHPWYYELFAIWVMLLGLSFVVGKKAGAKWFIGKTRCYVRWTFQRVWRGVRWIVRRLYNFLTSRQTWRTIWRIIRGIARFVRRVLRLIWRGLVQLYRGIVYVLTWIGAYAYATAVAIHSGLISRWPQATLVLYGITVLGLCSFSGYELWAHFHHHR